MSRILPSQLVSLIHHIALNESGWWNKAIQNFIISIVWLNKNPSTIDRIAEDLKNNFGITLENGILKSNIQELCTQKVIFELSEGNFKLSETSRKKFEIDLTDHENLINRAEQFFKNQIKINCPDLTAENCWKKFNENLLIPTVNQLGAKTYELISGNTSSIDQTSIFQEYIYGFEEKLRGEIKKVIIAFFDSNNSDCRSYILRMINSYFYLEAGNLSSENLQKLNSLQRKNIEFNLFIDTNFLFSIMNLHDNPSNEAATSLKNLIDKIKNKINVKLFVTGKTLEEAYGVLDYQKNKLKGIALKKNIIEAAKNYDFSGFEKKYFDEIHKSNKAITAVDYFAPYLNNLKRIVREHGVEFHNENYDKYSMEQKVIDDIRDSQEYQKSFEKQKTYEQLLHDIMLWHFVKDKRPNYIESHVDARFWIVTIDFRFLGFDRYKGKGHDSEINLICMHPASLIQMLQFWVPRSKEFEEAILSNIRTPLFYNEFDNDSEQMANVILMRLSRFEDIEDMSVESITAVLQNEVLKRKLKSSQEVEEQINLIKDAIIEENNKIQNDLKKAESQKIALQALISEKDNEINELKTTVQSVKDEYQRQSQDFEKRITRFEKENNAKEKFEKDHKNWELNRREFVNQKWGEFSKPKYYLVYYIIIGLIILLLEYFLITDNSLKIYIPIGTTIVALILPFLLHKLKIDKIFDSFGLLFLSKRTKKNMLSKYEKEFIEEEPKIENYFKDSDN